MSRVCFVVGHDQDAPEAYWRVLLPAQALHEDALAIGNASVERRALQASVIWIHQPTSLKAAALAEVGQQQGRAVIVDFSEDPWLRWEVGEPYRPARLEAAERALQAATVIVVAGSNLASVFAGQGTPVAVLEPVIALDAGWEPRHPTEPPILGWWSDGRQRSGFELVAPALRQVLVDTDVHIHHFQFAHHDPLMAPPARLGAHFQGKSPVTSAMLMLRDRFAGSMISLDCYPPGHYCERVSDLPLLRAAALGIPSVTTRNPPPPGAVSASPQHWAEAIETLLEDPEKHRGLSLAARAWADSRSTYATYAALIEEVLPCLSTT